MDTLRAYKRPTLNDYIATLSEEELVKQRLNQAVEFNYRRMVEKLEEDFCTGNQHIVSALVTELAAANPSIPYSFFIESSKLPLVACNEATTPAWQFSDSTLCYHPGIIEVNVYRVNFYQLGTVVDQAWKLMDTCCQKKQCENHRTISSIRYNECMRMLKCYDTPLRHFSILTGEEYFV